jgi:hypothetical protein
MMNVSSALRLMNKDGSSNGKSMRNLSKWRQLTTICMTVPIDVARYGVLEHVFRSDANKGLEQSCLKLYLKKHKQCPICRKDFDLSRAQRVTNVRYLQKPSEASTRLPPQPRPQEYNRMAPEVLSEISKVETNGSYGSKIQSIVRHLVWLQENEPGAKSIVFSAWADVRTALAVLISFPWC